MVLRSQFIKNYERALIGQQINQKKTFEAQNN